MKKTLTIILSIGMLAGCSPALDKQADEVEVEVEETAELIEAEVKTVAESMKQDLVDTADEADQLLVTEGEQAVVIRDVLLPLNEEGYDNLYSFIETSDYNNIEEMRESGNLLLIKEDTEVEVLEIDILQAKVKVESSGKEGYIPTKYLEQVSS